MNPCSRNNMFTDHFIEVTTVFLLNLYWLWSNKQSNLELVNPRACQSSPNKHNHHFENSWLTTLNKWLLVFQHLAEKFRLPASGECLETVLWRKCGAQQCAPITIYQNGPHLGFHPTLGFVITPMKQELLSAHSRGIITEEERVTELRNCLQQGSFVELTPFINTGLRETSKHQRFY